MSRIMGGVPYGLHFPDMGQWGRPISKPVSRSDVIKCSNPVVSCESNCLKTVENIFPLDSCVFPFGDHPGTFGFNRKHDIHTGVDLYTTDGANVFCIEDGIVVKVDVFTGPSIGTDWWKETWAVMIEGSSGVINYGEIKSNVVVGQRVNRGDIVGTVTPVLPVDKKREDIPGHSCSMLHVELYEIGCRDFAIWKLDEQKPKGLLDPTDLLKKCVFEKC